MFELLLLVQAITTAALAFFVIILRRELYPALVTAGPADDVLTPLMRLWIRSIYVLVVDAPQFSVSKSIIRIRRVTSEELFLRFRIGVYDVPMHYSSRRFYKEWKAWLGGDRRYDCRVKKPRGLAKLYNKAIDVVCFDKEKEERKWREEVQKYLSMPTKYRKRRYKRWRKPRPRRERATLYDLVEKFEKLK
jgi:hypothetical protein